MTKSREPEGRGVRRCEWCRRPLPATKGPGRPRRYCRQACRQQAYEARRRAAEIGLADDELIVARRRLEALYDGLYALELSVADVEVALADEDGAQRARSLLSWLLASAHDLLAQRDTLLLDQSPEIDVL